MKLLIINKSDSTGGAAIVSRRLMEAFRSLGEDARMLVCEKLTDSPYVELAASPATIKRKFLWERLKIFRSNGFNKKTLFKIDTGETGLPLWKNPMVKEADAILLGWINQGMLSLEGIKKIVDLGKPVVWTMHDMWCFTGICHHAGSCNHFLKECGDCPLLGDNGSSNDLSRKIWRKKRELYNSGEGARRKIGFVAVSRWLKEKALSSGLLGGGKLEIISNPYQPVPELLPKGREGRIRILFGAARIDDPIKGLDTLHRTAEILKSVHPEYAGRIEFRFFGDIKDSEKLEKFPTYYEMLGRLEGEKRLAEIYDNSLILVSASSYETFGYTLLEAQAYGCLPVSFSQGGQTDIIRHKETGYLAEFDEDINKRAKNLADGIDWAIEISRNPEALKNVREQMRKNVEENFSYDIIARKYLSLIYQLSEPWPEI